VIVGLAHAGGDALLWSFVAVGGVVVFVYPLTAWILGSSSLALVDGTIRRTSWLRRAKSCPLSAVSEVVELPLVFYRPDLGFHERWLLFVGADRNVLMRAYAGYYAPEAVARFRSALGVPWESVNRAMTPAQARRAVPHAFPWPWAHWALTLLGLLVTAYLVAVIVLAIVYAVT
jgi:hypothetical protein